ncbi:hypothetical protein BHE74_00027705 [Ensete ventricosum]|nr:hypothetical protein BHE74_00027705 [Ensete ventricosum]RZR89840.1 hypothetical protein BHM03_00017642 [Ensete ventricosum]
MGGSDELGEPAGISALPDPGAAEEHPLHVPLEGPLRRQGGEPPPSRRSGRREGGGGGSVEAMEDRHRGNRARTVSGGGGQRMKRKRAGGDLLILSTVSSRKKRDKHVTPSGMEEASFLPQGRLGVMHEEEDLESVSSSFNGEEGDSDEEPREDATSSGSPFSFYPPSCTPSLDDHVEDGPLFEMSSLISLLPIK